jgi:hypothetical protein
MAGLIQTGATYRDRALSGIVAESGLAQKRELASKEFERQKIEGVGKGIETGIKDVVKIVSMVFSGMGMMGGEATGASAAETSAAYNVAAGRQGWPLMEESVGPVQTPGLGGE